MTEQLPAKPFIVALVFGEGPAQQIVVQEVMAPEHGAAIAMAVSRAYVSGATAQPLSGIHAGQLTREFIEAARRGFVGEASVVSLVSPAPPETKAVDGGIHHRDGAGMIDGHVFWRRDDGHCLTCGVRADEHKIIYGDPAPPAA